MLKFPNFSFPIPRHTFPLLRCKTYRPYVGPKEFSKFEHVSSTRFPFIVDRRTEPLWGTRDFCRTLQSPTSVVHQCHQPSSGTLWQMFPTTGLYLYDTRSGVARPEAEPVVKVSVLSLHRATANQALAGCFTPAPSVLYVGA